MNNYVLMARFNSWVNDRIYACVAGLPEDSYRADQGAFFGSVHGTLNHLLLVDRLWTARLQGTIEKFSSLAQILYDDLPSLTEARKAEDQRLIDLVESYSDADLKGEVTFTMMSQPGDMTMRRDHILLTLYNHQTHHRGQIHCLLTQCDLATPDLDLPIYLRQL